MPLRRRRIGWFSPDPRGVILPGDLRISRSLRQSTRRYRITVNAAFDDVLRACADPGRPHGWIDRRVIGAYTQLHHLGVTHSIEAWDDDGLAGGLYGVSIGRFFAGESMFHRRRDASKVALVHLVELLSDTADAPWLLDVQWVTPHLASLGARAVPRLGYAHLLVDALEHAAPDVFAPAPGPMLR